jgi:hypothetical protein
VGQLSDYDKNGAMNSTTSGPVTDHSRIPRKVQLRLAHKNFAGTQGICHIGLGVSAANTCKVLRNRWIDCDVWPITGADDLHTRLQQTPTITHIVISAPWIPTAELISLAYQHPDVEFTVNCHSNVGFLQADSNGVRILKELIHAEHGTWNIHVGGNSRRFVSWVESAFHAPCAYLPNLYYLDKFAQDPTPPYTPGATLKIGAFGATRVLKNMLSSAGAALDIAETLGADTQLWINKGREDGGGTMIRAVRELLARKSRITLHEAQWTSPAEFKDRYVRMMHLVLQPSYTESFNIVSADAVSLGVPVVASPAIDWVPKHWQANPDDTGDIARVGLCLLRDPRAWRDGLKALERHVSEGTRLWLSYLYGTAQ